MYSTPISIKTVNGTGDMVSLIDYVGQAVQPTAGDLLYAGQRQRTRILERTERGVDFNNRSFHPYSTTGPYYYYPNKSGANRRASSTRLAKKLGISAKGETKIKAHGSFHVSHGAKVAKSLTASRTRLGIKFSSYAAFKAALGRGVVDLLGPRAPHMLQALIIKIDGAPQEAGADRTTPASEIIIGIYGEEAKRASGHNEGHSHLPQRKFLSASDADKKAVLSDIVARAAARGRKILGGRA